MRYINISIFIILAYITYAHASDCIVSEWGGWSECYGDCSFGQAVRNRDVLRPPIPINRSYIPQCPHLYETRKCQPENCYHRQTETPYRRAPTTHAYGIVTNTRNTLNSEELMNVGSNDEIRSWRIRRPHTTTNTPITTTTQTEKEDDEKKWEHSSFITEAPEQDESPPPASPKYFVNELTIDLPRRLKPAIERTPQYTLLTKQRTTPPPMITTDSTMSEVLRQLETTADFKLSLENKKIRNALNKNRKLMKAIVQAYRYRSMTPHTMVTVMEMDKTPNMIMKDENMPTTTITPIIQEETISTTPEYIENRRTHNSTSSSMTSPLFWPKRGYVPNTRKHAAEITSKLYVTHDIIQQMNDEPLREAPAPRVLCKENPRCCRVERTECSEGEPPRYIKRFYRPPGSPICLAYHYPRCSQEEEREEQPILFEQNCQDLCFAPYEKKISPLFVLSIDNDPLRH